MSEFRLTEAAYRDLDSILAFVLDQSGTDAAYDLRSDLFETFARLAEYPGLGHKRLDFTSRPFVFFTRTPYVIMFDRTSDPLTIHAVLHGARDIPRILRKRRP